MKTFLVWLLSSFRTVRRWAVVLSFLIWISSFVHLAEATVTFTTNTLIDTSNLAYEGQDIVIKGCTVTANGRHAFNSVSLMNVAVLTHQPATISNEYSLVLTVANNLLVDATSTIDVSGRGYLPDYTFGNTTNGASTYLAGGSYGGLGGTFNGIPLNAVYGDFHNPNELGSGSGDYSGGAAGGGLVRITAANAQVDGAIRANGADGYDGASGGGIFLSVGGLSGGGQITANGGSASGNNGGGGGRVAIYYSTSNFNFGTSVTANAGTGPSVIGSVGTVYLQQTGSLGQLVISSHGTKVGQWTPLGVGTDTVFQVDTLLITGTNVVAAPEHQMPMFAGSISITNAGTLTHQPTTAAQEYSLLLTVTNNLQVDSSSSIDVSGRGYLPGYTLGNTTTGAATGTAGGSYGGLGGLCCNSTGNAVYGDYHNPNELGSGSGSYSGGAAGGGLVRITTGSAQVDGAILANGGSGYDGASGGAIFLSVGGLSGGGQISANGGNASGNDGGGGGRVAIYYGSSSLNLAGNVTAHAGIGPSVIGSVGTVYLKPTSGPDQLVISSHGTKVGLWTPLGAATDTSVQVDTLFINGTNVVVASSHQMPLLAGSLSVTNGAALTHQPTTATQEYSLLLTVTNGLLVDSSSTIDVSARGYLPGHTLGNTTAGAATGLAGGSYGGLGGTFNGIQGNAVYGDYHNPNELGSGSGTYSTGGSGGGLVRIIAGSAQVDGAILANGGNNYDGGSGGGIYLSLGALNGNGHITANGGSAGGNDGGGGGRVAIYYSSATFNLANNVTATGGSGPSVPGSVGTVYLKQTGSLGQLVINNHGTAAGQWTPLGQTTDLVFTAEALVLSGSGTVAQTVSGAPIQASSVSLLNGAVLTHPPTTPTQEYALVLTVTSNLIVDSSSSIDVSARGYLAGYTFGNTTNGASTYLAGGSYGGLGGTFNGIQVNGAYGDYHNPAELGSGSGDYSGGAAGGGLARITAGSALVDGAILANGGDGYDGASGGGVLLNVGTLSGSGRITANGGSATGNDGGGGGRVAIYYGTNSFNLSSNVTAHAGTGPSVDGSVGTVFLQPTGGLAQLVISSHGTPAGQWTPLGVATDTVFQVDTLLLSGTNVVAAPEHQMAMDVGAASLVEGAVLTHQLTTPAQEYSLLLTITNNLVVDIASRIDVSARGYLPGYTFGNTTNGAASHTAGGSYGGLGGLCCGSTGNAVYGDYHNPNELGSASGNYNGGAPGGGLVRITAGSAQVDGAILANGGNGYDGASGGGVFLSVGALSGNGEITANGGNASGNDGGGGGRVAIYYTSAGFNLSNNVAADGGSGPSVSGSVGTVYLKQTGSLGQLVINNHGTATGLWTPLGQISDLMFKAEALVLSGTGTVAATVAGAPIQAASLSVLNGAMLTHQPTTTAQEYALVLMVTNNLLVDGSSTIDVSARGYLPGYTFGNTPIGAATANAGGSYGGLGGLCCNSTGDAVYGDFRNPNELGSGSGNYSGGAPGGGLVRITAGSAQLDGAILANGGNGYDGGSGGGVFLSLGALNGGGRITANGGNAAGNDGGGGGRVAIYYGSGSFDLSSNVLANGGSGPSVPGSLGTVYLQQAGGLGQLVINSHGANAGQWTPLGVATDTVFQVDTLLVSGTNVVAAPQHQMAMNVGAVSIVDGAVLTHQATTPGQEYSLLLTVTSNLLVDSASRIDVSGLGYLPDYTLGDTKMGGATFTAAGSYGGLGGLCCNATGNALYGDYHNPDELGSGSGDYGGGASGGGLVRITAGAAQVDGGILANGSAGYDGGSGGGVLLNVGTLSGSGQVTANGGSASGNDGGGGGRVAVYTWAAMHLSATNILANGGHGPTVNGQTGSVYIAAAPFFTFSHLPRIWHGVEEISWLAIGIDPNAGDTAEAAISKDGITYFKQSAATSTNIFWNTAGVSDGTYTLTVDFFNASGGPVGQISQGELINNSAIWHEGTLTTNETWASGTVHLVDQSVIVPSGVTLTISPGAIVKFAKGTGITVEAGGILNALGTGAQSIILTSLADDSAGGDSDLDSGNTPPQPGDWASIAVLGGQFNSNQYLDIRYSQNSVGGTLATSQSWLGTSVYVVSNSVVVPTGLTLTINPGAVVKFIPGTGLTVQSGGTLNAIGTVAQPITFTSFKDDSVGGDSDNDGSSSPPAAGDWVGFNISGQASFSHSDIRYGGNTGSGAFASGVIIVNSGSLALSNSVVETALYDGISVYGGTGTGVILNSVLRGTDRTIWAYGGGNVRLVNCTFDQNVVGLDNHGSGTIDAENCIIANSIQASAIEGAVTVRYSDIWSSYTNSSNPISIGQNGNISADPKFINAAKGDYRLNYLSPCIDAADGTKAPATDFQGDPRYNDPRTLTKTGVPNASGVYPDIGAFEFIETAPSPVDLIADSVVGPTELQAGQTVTVQWTDLNRGTGHAVGPWHDSVSLVSISDTNNVLPAGEILTAQGVVLGPGEVYLNSATFRVPGGIAGNYRWQVHVNDRGDVFEGANWTNNLAEADTPTALTVPLLSLDGSAVTNLFTTANTAFYFSFVPQTNQDIQVTLNLISGGGTVNLYIGQGYMPDPLHFDFRQGQWNSSSASTLVPGSSAQPYYVLAVLPSLSSAPAQFSISATALGFQLTSISPTVVGNGGPATLLIQGSQLTTGMTYQVVDPSARSHNAISVCAVNNTLIDATFDFTGLPIGKYTVRIAGTAASLPNVLQVEQAPPGKLTLQITGPRYQRLGRAITLLVDYCNIGGSDIVDPILVLRASNAQFRLPGQSAWSPGVFDILATNLLGCAGVLPPGYCGEIEVELSQQIVAAGTVVYVVSPAGGTPQATGQTTFVGSSDPNDKIGLGFGTQGFVTGGGGLFYTIDFANQTNATAPAQQVVVTDHLDSNLDWSSFKLQTIAFNNVTITVPPGLQNYSTVVNVPTDPNPVDVTVSFDPVGGLITWQMQSIDPTTLEQVTDPLAGFLPPDNAQHAGEGYVTYVVNPKPALGAGARILNQASIVFDVNAPILTQTVTNTIDNSLPLSAMTPLPLIASTNNLLVSWSGSDAGSAVASFDIFVSTNNGPWTLWLLNTTNTSAVFPGANGNTYAFYSVAMDDAGNVEASPKIPGTQTIVASSQVPFLVSPQFSNGLFQCSVLAAAGNRYVVQTSTNLANWTPVKTNTAPFLFTDPNLPNHPGKWYRAVLAP